VALMSGLPHPEDSCLSAADVALQAALKVWDEDVRDLPALSGDPIAQRARLLGRERAVGEHRIFAPVDQRARDRGSALRLSVVRRLSFRGGGSLTNTS